jgi:hypothetical protein
MFEWKIGREEVIEVLQNGETIRNIPTISRSGDDKPFQSCLMLGYTTGRPLHVVAALDPVTSTCCVITA